MQQQQQQQRNNKAISCGLLLLLLLCLQLPHNGACFDDAAIFEEEDIYRLALPPPVPGTGITVPGTKWCGPGNKADNFDDLGTHRETDMCCREHDHCDEIIEPDQILHGISNDDMFPIMKCSCEQVFLNCLQRVNNIVSSTLGRVYFGSRSQCFAYGHPIRSCREYQRGTFRRRCILYEVDERRDKLWQLYATPFYTN